MHEFLPAFFCLNGLNNQTRLKSRLTPWTMRGCEGEVERGSGLTDVLSVGPGPVERSGFLQGQSLYISVFPGGDCEECGGFCFIATTRNNATGVHLETRKLFYREKKKKSFATFSLVKTELPCYPCGSRRRSSAEIWAGATQGVFQPCGVPKRSRYPIQPGIVCVCVCVCACVLGFTRAFYS